MKRSFKALLAAVLIAVPMLASCNDAQNPIAPTTNVEQQGGLIGGVVDLVGGVVRLLGNILSGPDANGAATSAWIGTEGGTITTAAYTLTVPQGAVTRLTKFVVEPSNTGRYMLELRAYERGLLGTIDVGSRGFRTPVSLTISYANASGVTNIDLLGIIYIAAPDKVVLQPTVVDPRNATVTSQLSHFSKYAMVQN